MEGKKLRSLLRFYKKKDVEIELQVNLKKGMLVKGKISKLRCIFGGYLVLQSLDGTPIKIFFDEIMEKSIIPVCLAKESSEENKKEKKCRSPISPKLRFDVLQRDNYTCKYCGVSGVKAELEVDHIVPVSRGGKDELDNLKTACFDCNRGKGDRV